MSGGEATTIASRTAHVRNLCGEGELCMSHWQESFEDAIGWLKEWACSRRPLRYVRKILDVAKVA